MPTYDYVCAACGHAFEQFQEMSAKKLRKCPKCGKSALERQVGAGAGLIFKGSGFYITDYKHASASEAAARQKDTAPSGTAKPSEDKGSGPSGGDAAGPKVQKDSGKQEGPAAAPGTASTPPKGSGATTSAPPPASAPKAAPAAQKGREGRGGKASS
jgi:putative FmdB family regulatory protein